MKPYLHAKNSAKKYGGIWEDYMEIHELIDSSKAYFPDNRHCAIFHHSAGIFYMEKLFGVYFDGKEISIRDICEQHILEDFNSKFLPTPQDFLQEMDFKQWMENGLNGSPDSHKKLTLPEIIPPVTPFNPHRPFNPGWDDNIHKTLD